MLTPTDIHYVVGLLTQLTSPENVDLELGSLVYDEFSQTWRDVDVTIKVKNPDNTVTIFKALEVKAHGRKMGSEKVEQLIQKLMDMPSIDRAAIVSASGFSAPAIKKAERHLVDLYELRKWKSSDDFDSFDHIILPGVFTSFQWLSPVQVRLNPSHPLSEAELAIARSDPFVYFPDNPGTQSKRLFDWLRDFKSVTAAELQKRIPNTGSEESEVTSVTINVRILGRAEIVQENVTIEIDELQFRGQFERNTTKTPSDFKGLFKVGDKTPLAGCCISELPDQSLMTMAITSGKTIQLGVLPLSDRLRGKIFRQKFVTLSEDA